MTTHTTNILPNNSLKADWSSVWQTFLATDYVARKRLRLIVIMLIISYIVGCVLHATGFGFVNIITGSLAMIATALYAARPVALAIFALGGAATAIDSKIDLAPGVKQGLITLGRLVNAVMMFIGLTFLLLGTWPLSVPVWMYALVPMGTALLINILIYEKMMSAGWVWKLFGTYIIAMLVLGAIGNIPIISSLLGWANVQQEKLAAEIDKSTGQEDPVAAEAAHDANVEETRRNAELTAAAIVPPPARTEAADVRNDCGGRYAELTNCRNVYFGENEIYRTEIQPRINPETEKEEAWCTFSDPVDAGYWTHIAGRQFVFTPNYDSGVRVTFFEVKQGGSSFTGVPCE